MAELFQGFIDKDGADRIRVRRGDTSVLLAPGSPTLSSWRSAWEGALLERHTHGPHESEKHQHLSHFLCLHLSEPAPLVWRSERKQESTLLVPGSLILLSRGTEDAVIFPKAVRRILLDLEPILFEQVIPEHYPGRDVELENRWGVMDQQIEYILRALEADLQAGLPSGQLFGESLLCALAVHLQRRYGVAPLRETKPRNRLPKARVQRVLDLSNQISIARSRWEPWRRRRE